MSRRHEDVACKLSSLKAMDRQVESGNDHHFPPRHSDARDDRPLRPRRSLSPRPIVERRRTISRDQGRHSLEKRDFERPYAHDRGDHVKSIGQGREQVERREYERTLVQDRGNSLKSTELGRDSVEKREYERHLPLDGDDQIRSRSPPLPPQPPLLPIERPVKRPHVNGRVMDTSPPPMDKRKYRYDYPPEYPEFVDDPNIRLKQGYHYEDHVTIRKDDYDKRRLVSTPGHGTVVKHPLVVEDAAARQMVRSREEYGIIASDYRGTSGSYSTLGMHRLRDENDRHQDLVSHEMYLAERYYNNEDRLKYHRRDASCPLSPTSKDIAAERLIKGIPRSSSGYVLRDEITENPQDSPLPRHPNRYEEIPEPLGGDDYGKRRHFDHVEDNRTGHAGMRCPDCDVCNSSREDRNDYIYSHPRVRVDDDPGYRSRGVYGKVAVHVAPNIDCRNVPRPTTLDTHEYFAGTEAEGSRRLHRSSGIRESDLLRKELLPHYLEMRTMDAPKQDRDYLDPSYDRVEFVKRDSHNHPISEVDVLREHGIPASRLIHEDGRYGSAGSHLERTRNPSGFIDDMVMERLAGRAERAKASEYVSYGRAPKRNYSMGGMDDLHMVNPRTGLSYTSERGIGLKDLDDRRGEWVGRTSSGLHTKDNYVRDHYLEADEMFDEIYRDKEYRSAHSTRMYKSENAYLRCAKSESSKTYGQPHNLGGKVDHYKRHTNWRRNDDENDIHLVASDTDTHGPRRHAPPDEQSESFKQRVQMSFLDFSKRMNENPVARKLYKEQGKAGSLFCIVCGRSSSKEFHNTQSLVTHSYMARKPSMRAQHLGLHKAVCVLMGWNSVAPPDVITWAPNVLPEDEALAQKEDLILWPPIVIMHNISLSNENHKEWKVVSPETLATFLRAKGFCRGKMKITLGNPGDQSVMLIKFLATFSGLQEAEKLQKYFAEQQRGRLEFGKAFTDIGKSSGCGQGETEADQIDEHLLYGYMGISEDMDWIDFDTKKRCTIRSKKEIHELADAPVKTE